MGENVRDTVVTIGTASTLLSIDKIGSTKRTALVITNTSTAGQVLSFAWGKAAVAGSGVVLYPGGSWSESVDNRFTPSPKEIFGISSAAGGTAAVSERLEGV